MKIMNRYDNNTDITEVATEDLEKMMLMIGHDEDTLKILRDEHGNENRYRNELIDYIIDFALERGFDDDQPYYNSLYWFFRGSQTNAEREAETEEFINGMMNIGYQPKIKHIGVPHAPKHTRPPVRYVDTDDYKRRQQKKVDDRFFNDLRSHPRVEYDPLTKLMRSTLNKKFVDSVRKESDQIKTSKVNYKQMLDKLIRERPILRPLPPGELLELKPYSLQLFEKNNRDLIDYFETFGHEFTSKNDEYLTVNKPNDEVKALAAYQMKKYHGSHIENKTRDKNPIVVYYLNEIHKLDDIFNYLENTVYKNERKPFKITFNLSGIFEIPKKLGDEITEYTYEDREICPTKYKNDSNIPILIQLNDELNRVKFYIESILFNYSTTESNVKLIYVTSIAFTVSRLVKVTGKVSLPKELVSSKMIIADNDDDGLCWYRFLSICLNPQLKNTKKYDLAKRTSAARKLLCMDHGVSYSTKPTKVAQSIINSFNGMSIEEMKESAMKNHINVNIYSYDKDSHCYDIQDQWYDESNQNTFNALLYSDGVVCHIMFIIDAEKLTKIFICPKCNSYVVRNENRHGSERMKKHMDHCDGKFHKKFIPERISEPYCPHILNHPVYEFCLAHDLEWKPQSLYMTYDFETMERKVDIKCGESTVINSELIPLSVSCCVKSSSDTLTEHFDARDKNFIPEWIKFMFKQSVKLVKDKIKFLSEMVHIDDIEKLHKLDRNLYTVTVFGYNSTRFDSNLFKEYLNYEYDNMKWTVDNTSLIGSPSAMKQFIIKWGMYGLRFIDAQSFVSGGTLKQFGEDFGGESNSDDDESNSVKDAADDDDNKKSKLVKGVFPYEAINSDNFDDVLKKSEPFSHDDFYSYLNQKNLLDDDGYEIYLKDSEKFKTRWDYLLSYNDNDVKMMIKPIDKLIEMNSKYGVDLLSNLSLSRNASEIKYAMAYKDFDPHVDYSIVNESNTFKPTLKWWEYKCDCYYKQDEEYNRKHKDSSRDLDKCVSVDDFESFMKMYNDPLLGKCHLCGEHFTYYNKPTLDRIDNEIGHELRNCKLACEVCNKIRSNSDLEVTRLRIQLKED